RLAGVTVGINQPYSPADRVYFTLERHARPRELPCAMIEIRNDEISDEAGQRKWADLLTGIFSDLEPSYGSQGSGRRGLGKTVEPVN
ncbi:MAG: N-formylglutamate amidohydrolase, partial [Mesorhizobium sp.]